MSNQTNNHVTLVACNDDGKLIRKDFHNGTYELYSYEPRSKLTDIVLKKSNNDVLSSHQYVYDASTGRFLSRDPVGDGSNWYVYCQNSPVSFYDMLGLQKKKLKGGEAIAAAAKAIIDDIESYKKKYPGQDKPGYDKYTACDRFVKECAKVHDSGITKYGGATVVGNYLKNSASKNDKWESIDKDKYKPKPGDILVRKGHVAVVGVDGNVWQASHGDYAPKNLGKSPKPEKWDAIIRAKVD